MGDQPLRWHSYEFQEGATLDLLTSQVNALLDSSNDGSLKHDLQFVAAKLAPDAQQLRVYVLEDGTRLAGIAVLTADQSKLALTVGPLVLLRIPVTRTVASVAPLYANGLPGIDADRCSADLVDAVVRAAGPRGVVMLQAVAVDTAFLRYATGDLFPGRSRRFKTVQHGKHQRHFRISLPDSFDAYLARLDRPVRADFRRALKRFNASTQGRWSLRVYTAEHEVADFYREACAVSQTTWQHRQYGAGLGDASRQIPAFAAAARLGAFRSYVLFNDVTPMAFRVGYVRRGVYYSEMTGYDPQYSGLHVGVVLVLEVIKDLINWGHVPGGIDLDSTENELKRRLSDKSTVEGYYYLFPKSAFGLCAGYALQAANALSRALKPLATRLGWVRPPQGSR